MTIVPDTCSMENANLEQRNSCWPGLMHLQATGQGCLAHGGGIQCCWVCQQGQDADNCDDKNEDPPSMQVPAQEHPRLSALQH